VPVGPAVGTVAAPAVGIVVEGAIETAGGHGVAVELGTEGVGQAFGAAFVVVSVAAVEPVAVGVHVLAAVDSDQEADLH